MTYDQLVKIGLEMPEVEEGSAYGTPALRRKKKFMLRLKEDGGSVAVKLDWDNHDRLLAEHPGVIFKTAHYDGYPAFLAHLDRLTPELATEILELSWQNAPHPAKTVPKA